VLSHRANEWQDVSIPLERFLQTWRGKLVEHPEALNPQRIRTLGISLAGGADLQPEGSFKLEIASIKAVREQS
jgi:NADH dehydrogenase [ubiquinone] 1 alpha subcomplex assembly factor 1